MNQSDLSPTPTRIARTYYVIAALYTLAASLIWGVNTLFLLREGGLTLLEVFIANAVFTGSMAFFELPTGIVADTRGRRYSFLLSTLVLAAGTIGYIGVARAGLGLASFCVASVVLGLGYTFYSGAVEAWVVDALTAAGHTGPVDRVLARGQLASSAAMLVGTIGGGFLGNVNLNLPYIVRVGVLLLAFAYALVAMREIGFTVRRLRLREAPAAIVEQGREGIRFGWRVPRARLAILAGAMPAIFLEWGYHAWQPYFLGLLGSDAVWVLGAIAAAISLSMMLGNWLVERITRFCGRRTTLLLGAALAFALAAIGVGLTTSFPLAVGLYLVAMMAAGVFQPVRQAYLHMVVPAEKRATVLSLASLVSSGGSMGGQAGLGLLASRGSLAAGYIAGGLAAGLAVPFLAFMRRLGGEPDRIVGEAGRYGTCETGALPEGVAVAARREVA
ncbi:MAG: MFS transporter [Gemmatimonadota bacterium]|jgi:MFS family permease